MKICITGATGYIGQALTAMLSEQQSIDVKLLSRDDCRALQEYESDFSAVESRIIEKVRGSDAVIHLAGRAHILNGNDKYAEEEFHFVNVALTASLARLSVALSVRQFIFISSIGVIGDTSTSVLFSESSNTNPKTTYAKSKLTAEKVLAEILEPSSTSLTIIRPPLVFSANAPGNFNRLLRAVKTFPALPFRNTRSVRSLISLDNLVDFIFTCATHPGAMGETFVISDITISVRELIELLAKGMGRKVVLLPIPLDLTRGIARLLRKERAHNQLFGSLIIDSAKATRLLGWTPKSDPKELLILSGYKYNIDNN
ncbi:NAD-dependent epimerase/dehydratase family protein [Pseudomonas sp. RIT623]|uniref:NAD-dependent epimerase/dehydratase family protein n=1 Tax=Pseudomonas sp. RIT623 TaxID=2559075 RepID=UPI0021140450|nr:NAD-dependent epimerase/dehydratase family protein [Pseudomonas sp. RIT623]